MNEEIEKKVTCIIHLFMIPFLSPDDYAHREAPKREPPKKKKKEENGGYILCAIICIHHHFLSLRFADEIRPLRPASLFFLLGFFSSVS
jgi:hypothetical protein